MAKQTFTTGLVLTAAQMTSLQQTAMGGGSATTKTASYTLVAADAGTTVTMTSASATTITVNTSLFAAGDTVYIQNLGTGVSTITAGTATVNTSATLALAQYEGGQLYFTSTSASIFVKGAGAAATSGGMTLLTSGSLSGSSVSLTSIDQTYKMLQLNIIFIKVTSGSATLQFTVNANTNANYASCNIQSNAANTVTVQSATTSFDTMQINTSPLSVLSLMIPAYTQSTNAFQYGTFVGHRGSGAVNISGSWSLSTAEAAVTSIQIKTSASTFSAGTYELYGVK